MSGRVVLVVRWYRGGEWDVRERVGGEGWVVVVR